MDQNDKTSVLTDDIDRQSAINSDLQLTAISVSKSKNKKKKKKKKKIKLTRTQKVLQFFDKFFMLICLAFIIPIASQFPIGHNDGPLNPKITSSWVVTIILFFGIGLGVKLEYLKRACLFWQMNIFCHFIIFIYYPIIGYGIFQISQLLPSSVVSDEMTALLEGVIILCCLPATAASAVVFTMNAGGNEAAAAINCTVSQMLGIFLTPLLILIFMGSETEIDAADLFFKLSLRVVVPFFVAQAIRIAVGEGGRTLLNSKSVKTGIKKINEISLLYMVFCALSESFHVGIDANVYDILAFLLIIIVLHCHGYGAIWILASLFRCCLENKNKSQFMAFTVYDRIACIYSGVSKTIALGIPLIETIYGNDENVGMYILPILFYHPSNLIFGSLLVEPFKKLAAKEKIGSIMTNASGFTNFTHGTDYGAISPFTPFTPRTDLENAFNIFAPFNPLPDEPEEYEEVDDDEEDDENDSNQIYN